jgi:aspartate/methionine/tyrosine aminotransferase
MKPNDFTLERYFAKYEFAVEYLLSASDCESFTLTELLQMAEPGELQAWHGLKLGYTESAGRPELREAIAGLYPGCTAADLLTVVPEEGILIALNTLLEQGDHVICVSPAYQSLSEIPKSLGCAVTEWPFQCQNGEWSLDLNFLERSITPRTKLIIINFPHNPTGYLPSRDFQRQLIEIARKQGIYLFSDEMYWLMELEPEAGRLEPAAVAYERGISLFGLSKTFGLPGLRTGWLVARDRELMTKLVSFKDYTTICGSAPGEILALIALKAKARIVERNLAIVRGNLALAADCFGRRHREEFGWIPPRAGSICFPELRLAVPVAEFCRGVVERRNVMILPGTVFHYPGNHFRVGLGRRDFGTALARFEEYLAEFG